MKDTSSEDWIITPTFYMERGEFPAVWGRLLV
jgi:hypothetical protein